MSLEGLIFIEAALRRQNSLISYYASYGDDKLDDVASFQAIYHIQGEDNGSDWSPLALDRSSSEYEEAIKSLDESIEAIRGSNNFSEKFPEEKEEIVNSLSKGLSRLEKGQINRHIIFSYLLSPLKWVASTFTQTALSAVASAAAQKLIQLLSSLVVNSPSIIRAEKARQQG